MQEQQLAGMVVFAYDRYCSAMHYVTGQKIVHGVYFRAADGRAHLIHDPMERDQAAAAGCEHSSFPQHGLAQKIEAEGAHPARGWGRLIGETCEQMGMNGAVAMLGDLSAGFAHAMIARALEAHPGMSVDVRHPDLLSIARATKEPDEIAAIRKAARGATGAIAKLREFLGALRSDGDAFRANGSGPVTLGMLRRVIHEEFLAHGLAEDGESIVSQGRDAGVPHNRGNDGELVRAGVPILVDIFPGEAGGGYHSDLTRTFCLGPAPPELKKLYDDVHAAFRVGMESVKVGAPCRSLQEKVCDVFEQRGHATQRSREGTEEGYVHGLGHGVGLAVHEAPRLGGPPSNSALLEPNMVITVEPGLYYPSRGLGVRIEDLVLVGEGGRIENLTPASYELEIEPRG